MKGFIALILMGVFGVAHAVEINPQTEAEFAGLILSCYSENAPEDWLQISFTYEKKGEDSNGKEIVEFSANSVRKVKAGHIVDKVQPCTPLAPAAIVSAWVRNQGESGQKFEVMHLDLKIDKTYEIRYDTRF